MGRCLEKLGGLPKKLVWDREGALHAGGGRPAAGFLETSFEPGRSFANELDFHAQLDRWFAERAN